MDGFVYYLVFFCMYADTATSDQELVNNIAQSLNVRYAVLDNFENSWRTFRGKITLENTGLDIPPGDEPAWEIYFCHNRLFEPETIRPNGTEITDTGLKVFHVNGCLHKFRPTSAFVGIRRDEMLAFEFRASDWSIARTDIMPNWYVTAPGAQARILDSTSGNALSWVADFDTKEKWKRQPEDTYDPYTAEFRLSLWKHVNTGLVQNILPTPVEENFDSKKTVNIFTEDWVVVAESSAVYEEAVFLADRLHTVALNVSNTPPNRYILLDLDPGLTHPESYTLNVNTETSIITINAADPAGVFYGTQSLASLAFPGGEVPHGTVRDQPRFGYRGMHVDVGRNFRSKADILKLLDVMSLYKLNKLHFHLTDDEGWRLEIPGLPELTEVGSHRCHDPNRTRCIMPQLGSPPGDYVHSGTGSYSVTEYREILRYANDRHIQVIPEFDMPGHSHAAIVSMLARYNTYRESNLEKATEYLLSEIGDPSQYISIQYFTDNSINPCLSSTYTFVRHIIEEVKTLHADIQPLSTFNFGGDEVPDGAWINSTVCRTGFPGQDTHTLKMLFVQNVSLLVYDADLDLAGWEDGFTRHDATGIVPIDRDDLPNDNVYGYFWNNVWEWGTGNRAYVMANLDYKVILAHATHLYFDHPQEPDPEERGYYWATRISPSVKTFSYMPDSIYNNMDVDRMGRPLNKDTICEDFGCETLDAGKEDNVIGMQGHLWSETVRTTLDFDTMVYTRLVALAERAWHKASWEDIADVTDRETKMASDWQNFANTVGHKELHRLDAMNVQYSILPPGARYNEDTEELTVVVEFPGLPILYSLDGAATWHQYSPGMKLQKSTVCNIDNIKLMASSADRRRHSRMVDVPVSVVCDVSSGERISWSVASMLIIVAAYTLQGVTL